MTVTAVHNGISQAEKALSMKLTKEQISNAELREEIAALREQIEGDPTRSLYFYQRKAHRQTAALHALTGKLTSLHFALRVMNQAREPLTREEYLAARAQIQNGQLKERISQTVPE